MKAVMTVGPRHMEVRDAPEPTPGPGEALVRIEAVGICGSDLHLYTGDHPYATFPQTQGHEFAGVVEGFGPGYEGPIRTGVRVAVEPLLPCGTCYPCRRGRPNCCTRMITLGVHVPGALTERIAVPGTLLYETGDLAPELAAMVEPVSIGVQAATRGAITADDQVVIFGAGPIGQAVLLAATDRGARALVMDRLPSRLELARRLGAEVTLDTAAGDPAAAVRAWTDGDGPGVVVDATGVPAVIRAAIDLVASAGRVVIVGLSDQEVSIPVIAFTRKELTVVGSRNNNGVFGAAVSQVQRHQDGVRALITHRFPLEQTPAAVAFALEHPAEVEKVMITMGADS